MREEFGRFLLSQDIEENRGGTVFSVVVMGLRPRAMVTVRNAALPDIKPNQPRAPIERVVDRRVIDSRLPCQGQAMVRGSPGAFIIP